MRLHLILVLLIVSLSSCSTFSYILPYEDLQKQINTTMGPHETNSVVIPFEANAEMKEFARRITSTTQGTKGKAKRLVEGILNKSQLNVHYNKALTKTGINLFYEGEGNCLAYTNLYIALARSIGLRAMFVDASLMVNSVEEKGEMIVNNGHICAAI
jgi:hypothetical protein